MPREVEIRVNLRPHQRRLFDDPCRFTVRLWHRRAGKTWVTLARMLVRALQAPRKDWRAYYVAPTYSQAKLVSWDLLKSFVASIPGVSINEAELRVDLPNGARIQLLGAENHHRLRGVYIDDLVLDEAAYVPSDAWFQVILVALADRKGTATVIGTPQGRMNLLYDLWEQADADPEWSRERLIHTDTNALDPEEVERLRRGMSEDEFEQELCCSFDAALKGAFYAKELTRAEEEGRITTVRHDPKLPVTAALDLGYSDLMPVLFAQRMSSEHRFIDCRAYENTTITDMVRDWRSLPFPIDLLVLPHDAKVHELGGTGETRQRIFEGLGLRTVLAPRQDPFEGIEQGKVLLRNCWFDREATKVFREALASYRSEYDALRRVHRMTPVHDWSSHYADAFRTYVTGRRNPLSSKPLRRPSWAA